MNLPTDPTALTWLVTWVAIGFGLIGTAFGVLGGHLSARRLARESGSLDKPDLALEFAYLPSGTPRTITVVLPELPTAQVVWRLVGSIRNTGKRAAQQVLAQIVVPKPVIDQQATYEFSHPGLVPGLESKHEVIGEFSITTALWPHIAPGDAVGLSQECMLESTRLKLVLSDVQTADGGLVGMEAQAELAWTGTLEVRSLDEGWQQASVSIRVAVGRSVGDVAKAQQAETQNALLKKSGMATATGARRLLARFRHARLARSTAATYFVTPRLSPGTGGGRVEANLAAGDWHALVWFGPKRVALVAVPKQPH